MVQPIRNLGQATRLGLLVRVTCSPCNRGDRTGHFVATDLAGSFGNYPVDVPKLTCPSQPKLNEPETLDSSKSAKWGADHPALNQHSPRIAR